MQAGFSPPRGSFISKLYGQLILRRDRSFYLSIYLWTIDDAIETKMTGTWILGNQKKNEN